MWARPYLPLLLLCVVQGAPVPPCPQNCTCSVLEGSKQELRCSSLDFLGKLQPKEASSITSLQLRDMNLLKIDSRLKDLRELEKLDLANNSISSLSNFPYLPKLISLSLNYNRIKHITAESLRKTLREIDISNNYINHIPKKILDLKHLKSLYLKNNPLSCTCDTIMVLDKLKNSGVAFPDRVECHSPQEYRGKPWQVVSCKYYENDLFDDDMIGDEPGSGEGSGELGNVYTTDDDAKADDFDSEYITEGKVFLESTSSPITEDEGSGDDSEIYFDTESTTAGALDEDYEGSGDIEPLIPIKTVHKVESPKACYFNCSTPNPISGPENSTITPPGLFDGISILWGDLSGETPKPSEPAQTPEPVLTVTTELAKERSGKIQPKSEIVSEVSKNSSGELERQLEEPKTKMSTTFIIVFVLLFLMICVVVYSVYKRRSRRIQRLNADQKEPEGKELMPLSKSVNEQPSLAEKTPLMNGQNGTNATKPRENAPTLSVDDVDYSPDDDEVQLRNNDNDNLLTPKMERVTIQVKELSAPKTPILVNRHLSDDGNIITTPSNGQQ